MPEEILPNSNLSSTSEPQAAESQPIVKNVKPAGNSPILKFVLLGAIAVLIVAGILGAYIYGKNSSNLTKNLVNSTPAPTQSSKNISLENYPYLRNEEIFINNKQITNTNGTIYKFAYSEDTDTLAYISGEKKSSYGGSSYLVPQFIYVQKVGESPKKIFTLIPDSEPNSEYTVQIKDVAFTPDGKELITTTNQVMSIWSLSGELQNEINLPKEDESGGLVFYYGDPRLSPDGTRILLTKGYYEGSSNAVVDLPTKKITGLGNTSYVLGEYFIGWLTGNKLISFEHDDYTSEQPLKSSFNIYSSDNNKEKSIPYNKFINNYIMAGDKLYVASSNSTGDISAKYNLESLDAKNGSVKTVAEIPSLKDYYIAGIRYSKSLNSIFLSFRRPITDQIDNKIYVINLNEPNPIFKLFQDNASFFYQ